MDLKQEKKEWSIYWKFLLISSIISVLVYVYNDLKVGLKSIVNIDKQISIMAQDNRYQNTRIEQNKANIQVLNNVTQDNKVEIEKVKIQLNNNTSSIQNFNAGLTNNNIIDNTQNKKIDKLMSKVINE